MPRGRAVPVESRFQDPVKISTVIDASTKKSIDVITGRLVSESEFDYIPTQGQVIDYLAKFYLQNHTN